MNEETRKLYLAREKRVADAVALKVPDRVPVTASFYFFAARHYGYTAQEAMYDAEKFVDMQLKAVLEFEPDLAQNNFGHMHFGHMLDAVDSKLYAWPGRKLPPDTAFQWIEGEYMKADEYDVFLSDPMDFMVRTYWPRTSGLKGLAKLPTFRNFTSYMGLGVFGAFGQPEVQETLEAIRKAGLAAARMTVFSRLFDEKVEQAGFPLQRSGIAHDSFDFIGDYLRGTKGVMLDMYRQPKKLLEACEMLTPLLIEAGIQSARRTGSEYVFIALHKGIDGFMSLEQFKRFYWPFLKELVLALIDAGLIPYVFWEGDCTSRLALIGDIPVAKAMYRFELTDLFKAKDVLGDRVCIRGNVPVSILATGQPDDVRAYCRKLIDYVGRGGGFIMDAAANVSDAKAENLHAMFDFTKEYGIY